MAAEQSNKGMKRWADLWIVRDGKGVMGHPCHSGHLAQDLARLVPDHEFERYVPADSPNVLSEEEARLLQRFHLSDPTLEEYEDYGPALVSLLRRLADFAEGSTNG